MVANVRRATWKAVAYVPSCLRGALESVLVGFDEVYLVLGEEGGDGLEDERLRLGAMLDT